MAGVLLGSVQSEARASAAIPWVLAAAATLWNPSSLCECETWVTCVIRWGLSMAWHIVTVTHPPRQCALVCVAQAFWHE
eukprot:scaffold163525_cov28-Tisochrysis_lutea.AAC.1